MAFAAMRFVLGMSHAGMFIMSFGLAVEYVGPRWRVFTGCLIETPFAIGKHQFRRWHWEEARQDWIQFNIPKYYYYSAQLNKYYHCPIIYKIFLKHM